MYGVRVKGGNKILRCAWQRYAYGIDVLRSSRLIPYLPSTVLGGPYSLIGNFEDRSITTVKVPTAR